MEGAFVFVRIGAEDGVEAKLSRGEKYKAYKENTVNSSSEIVAT